MAVEVEDGAATVAVDGPLASVHEYELITAPLVPVPVPDKVTLLAGNVMVCAPLVVTDGGVLTAAALTVILTVALVLKPLLSLAVKVNV